MEKENILISACLIGINCRYDGKNNKNNNIERLMEYYNLIPFCPEESGGLPTPRDPSEIRGDKVVSIKEKDVTTNFNSGAFLASSICISKKIKLAILKEDSPSCGVHFIHNGKFDGKKIEGQGITTKKLLSLGIKIISENEIEDLLKEHEDF